MKKYKKEQRIEILKELLERDDSYGSTGKDFLTFVEFDLISEIVEEMEGR